MSVGGSCERAAAAANPKSGKKNVQAPTFFRYTPGQQGANYNSGAQQRIVRVVDMPVDPMEPPRFKHKKVPNGKDFFLMLFNIFFFHSFGPSNFYDYIRSTLSSCSCTSFSTS